MPKLITRHHKYLLLAFIGLYFLAGQPPEFGEENLFFQGYPIPKPVIRIALGLNLEKIRIKSSSGMKIYQVSGAYKLLAEDAAEAEVRGRQDKLSEKFLVQTGQFRRRDEAEAAARALREKVSQRVTAQEGEGGAEGVFQVRAGDFLTRGDALSFIKKVNGLGIREAWIIREEVSAAENQPRWVTVNDQLISLSADASIYFIPATTESFLSFGGRTYRGILVLRGSRKGLILVNILNLEEYLKGVVPGELPPSYFNELEAQKAQAIAARTYALKNLGQFNDLGFDLMATPASQVYLGLSAESPLSSRAVEETRGEVAVYGGKLINALYMSTCGGATEDVEAMFEGGPVPYLKSTECVDEREDAAWTIKSPLIFPAVAVNGRTVSQHLAYLAALGVLPLESAPESWKETAEAAEVQGWIGKAAALLGKKSARPASESVLLDFPALARLMAESFDWQERVDNLMRKAEAERVLEGIAGLKPEERGPLAYFLVTGLYPEAENLADRNRRPTRAEAAYYIFKVLATYKDFAGQGTIHGLRAGRLTVHADGGDKEFELTSALLLFRDLEGSAAPASVLDLEAGDLIKWVASEGKIRFLQIVSSPVGNVLDYASQFHRWQTRISRDDLEARINQYYPIGRLVDIVPGKRGASRRVLEMTIIGQESQVQVKGLKIRQVLNLRDNLFVVDRQPAADGRVAVFVFSGQGWGHGVGLCQVGAFRMAQKGASYEEILKKYYHGISLQKMG
jgi:stage II sporulation protein D